MSDIENHPESAYRRGYQQGAYEALSAAEAGTPLSVLKRWAGLDLYKWRIAGLRELSETGQCERVLPPPAPTHE